MRRSIFVFAVAFALIVGVSLLATRDSAVGHAQQQPANNNSNQNSGQKAPEPLKAEKNAKNVTAEQVVETSIFVYGSRPVLEQIRRNGVERGRVCKPTCEVPGKVEEASYERRFVRGEKSDKDKVRVDQKMPTLEYSLIYGSGRLWGLINGAAFTPREDAAATFLSQHRHSIDSLVTLQRERFESHSSWQGQAKRPGSLCSGHGGPGQTKDPLLHKLEHLSRSLARV